MSFTIKNRSVSLTAAILLLVQALATGAEPAPSPSVPPDLQKDWLFQAQYRGKSLTMSEACTTAQDAAGGCDGIKDGSYGFHTASGRKPTWWQVDLGKTYSIKRVMIYNRPECPERAANFQLLISFDARNWKIAYRHNGKIFGGAWNHEPLEVPLDQVEARFVRVQLPSGAYLHLDEIEVYGLDAQKNLALHQPAEQSSTSPWSRPKFALQSERSEIVSYPVTQTIERGRKLADDLQAAGVPTEDARRSLDQIARAAATTPEDSPARRQLYFQASATIRQLALANPALNFDSLLFVKRRPGTFSHMSDQYYSWFARPGGGVYLLKNIKSGAPTLTCLTSSFAEGSFLSPDLSFDTRKILFAYCKYYPERNNLRNKLDKAAQPEDSFYHVFEMDLDGANLCQLSFGRYDDLFPRYLPSGEIVFLSTRRGTHFQTGKQSAAATLTSTLPDSFVRCGGDASRPVSIYTLHAMDPAGRNLRAISAFESFEWDPSVANDGRILYSRWDYVDRDNMPYMKLWATHPDGENPQIVYGNHTRIPHATFEPRSIPNSRKIILTGSAHHCLTGGSLLLLDPSLGIMDGDQPVTRLTPEVVFPEIEGWSYAYFANPYPLSERYYLCAWGGPIGPGCPPNVWGQKSVENALGLYLFDVYGNLELLYRDETISSMYPIPVCQRPLPPVMPDNVAWDGPQEGRILLSDVYAGLDGVARGSIKRLRIVAVPIKIQPDINTPNLGLTVDDPGKCVLGTVPVEADGSAYFRVPSSVPVFFQALDAQGRAVQTMRSATYVQPGQTLACIGCHEGRHTTPPAQNHSPLAMRRLAKLTPDPSGSWPLRFDQLVQPILNQNCTICHSAGSPDKLAAKYDLSPAKAWQSLVNFGRPSLAQHVREAYRRGRSLQNQGPSQTSSLLALLTSEKGHHNVQLDPLSLYRLSLWMDTYAQRLGSFSKEQENSLRQFRQQIAGLLE